MGMGMGMDCAMRCDAGKMGGEGESDGLMMEGVCMGVCCAMRGREDG